MFIEIRKFIKRGSSFINRVGGNFPGGNFSGGNFPGAGVYFRGIIFPGGIFPGGIFPSTIKRQGMSKKKDVLVILHRKKRMSFNSFDKNCTQENVQLHLQYGESWLGGIVVQQVTRLYFLNEIVLAHFGRSNRGLFLENKGKIHGGGCVKELFSLTCRLASPNFSKD